MPAPKPNFKHQFYAEFSRVFCVHNALTKITRQFRMLAKSDIPIGNHASVQASPHAPVMRLRIAQFFFGGTLWGNS